MDIDTYHDDRPIGSLSTFTLNTSTEIAFVFLDDMREINKQARAGWEVKGVIRQEPQDNVVLLMQRVSLSSLSHQYDMQFCLTSTDAQRGKGGLLHLITHNPEDHDIVCYLRNYRHDASLFLVRRSRADIPPPYDISHIPKYIALGLDRKTDRVSVRVSDYRGELSYYYDACSVCLSTQWSNREEIKIAVPTKFPEHKRAEALNQYQDIIAIYDALDKFHTSITPNNNQ